MNWIKIVDVVVTVVGLAASVLSKKIDDKKNLDQMRLTITEEVTKEVKKQLEKIES